MLVSEIARRVRTIFGDTTGVQLTDQALYDWINDAMRDIASKNGLLQIRADTTTDIGVAEYAVPPNLLTFISIYYEGNKLQSYTTNQSDEAGFNVAGNTSGIPVGFSQYGTIINLFPTPAAVGELLLYYTRVPTEVNSMGDTPELPLQYHNRIAEYCLAKAAEMDDDPSSLTKMQMFSQNIGEMKDADWLERDQYPHLGVPLPDSVGTYYDY